MPTESNADREFASTLRRSEETMTTVEIEGQSPRIGISIRALDLTVIAVQCADGTIETLPKAQRSIQAGDRLHAIGRPAQLRTLIETPGVVVHDEPRTGR